VRRQRKPSSAPQLLQQRQAQEQAGDYDQQQQQPQPQQAWVPQPQQRQRQRPGGDGEQGWFREQQPLGQWAQQQEGYVGPQALAQQQLQQWQGIGADSYDDGLLPVSYAPSPAWAAARDAAAAAAAAGGAGGGSSALLGGPYMQQQLQQQQRQPWPDTVFVSEQWGAEARQRRLAGVLCALVASLAVGHAPPRLHQCTDRRPRTPPHTPPHTNTHAYLRTPTRSMVQAAAVWRRARAARGHRGAQQPGPA
jgi:hypothetical protein